MGVATITAFAKKRDPAELTREDLQKIAKYMEENYCINPLKSFYTVAFTPAPGYSNPSYENQPEKRIIYCQNVLHAFEKPETLSDDRCVFTGMPASAVSFDVNERLPPGRCYRQHIPLLAGENVINFTPYGESGLPVSAEALLAFQAFPLGCAKVGGRLLAVHASDSTIMLKFCYDFLEDNLKSIQIAQEQGSSSLGERNLRAKTLLIDTIVKLYSNQQIQNQTLPFSATAYHFSNSGLGPSLDIYHIPLETTAFLQIAMTPKFLSAWQALCQRGWEITRVKRGQAEAEAPRFNILYEDLFRLPDEAPHFLRTYFLRRPIRARWDSDPRGQYSVLGQAELVSWKLTELFLRMVMGMEKERIDQIRKMGDDCVAYVLGEGDRRFFTGFLTARKYAELRSLLIRASVTLMKAGKKPLVDFDGYIQVFEEGEDPLRSDWRLARDLVLIRMVEQLYEQGWIQRYKDSLPAESEMEQVEKEDSKERE